MQKEIQILRRGLDVLQHDPMHIHQWGTQDQGYMALSVYLAGTIVALSLLPRGDNPFRKNSCV